MINMIDSYCYKMIVFH